MRERASVFAAVLAVCAIVSALGVGVVGYLANAGTAGARTELATQTGADVALEASLALAADATAQDSAMRDDISATFQGVPLSIFRSVTGEQPIEVGPDSTPVRLASIADLPSAAVLAEGAWPGSPGEVSMQADAAERAGLAPGDMLALGDGTVTLTATWRLDNPLDPRWLGDELVASGSSDKALGPIVVDESLWPEIDVSTRARWQIVPVVAEISAPDLATIVAGWDRLGSNVGADDRVDDLSYEDRGRLALTARELQARVDALASLAPVALLVIALIAVVTLVELGRLLVALRQREHALLWSRGAAARALGRGAGLEAALVGVVGALVGAFAAAATLAAQAGSDNTGPGNALWLVPSGVIAATVLIFSGTSLSAVRRLDSRGRVRGRTAGRSGAVAGVFLVGAAAGLAVWQLLLYGSPVTRSRDGASSVNPVAVTAPALALLALILLALAALPLLRGAVESRARRSPALGGSLVARTLARRLRLAIAPLVLCALACGQLVIAAGFAQTWDTSFSQTRALQAGSELAVSGSTLDPAILDAIQQTPGVTEVAPVSQDTALVGPDQASVVGVSPAALRSLALTADGLLDPAAAADAIASPADYPALRPGAFSILVTTTELVTAPSVRALLSDELGRLVSQPLEADGQRYSTTIDGDGWRLVGFDLDVGPGPADVGFQQELGTVSITSTDADLGEAWDAVWLDTTTARLDNIPTGVGVQLLAGVEQARVLPRLPSNSQGVAAAVAVSQQLADTLGVRIGDRVPIALDPRQPAVLCDVVAIIPAVPGADRASAVLVDLATVQALLLRTSERLPLPIEAWVGASDSAKTAAALREELPARVRIASLALDPGRSILGAAAVALWIGAAGAALLALVAIGAVAGAQLRTRRGDVVVLRSLGVEPGELARMRRRELGVVTALGGVIGMLAGGVVTLVTVPALARAAIPNPFVTLATGVSFAWLPLAAALLALAIAVWGVTVGYGAAVARQSRTLGAWEDAS